MQCGAKGGGDAGRLRAQQFSSVQFSSGRELGRMGALVSPKH
jgi:hypothetical protein